MRRSYCFAASLLGLIGILAGCDAPQPVEQTTRQVQSEQKSEQLVAEDKGLMPTRSSSNLLVASFNIQVFGVTKAQDDWVMQRLAELVKRFDVVAIQEIRSQDDRVLPALIEYINHDGHQYSFVISPRLGRTSSKEQYAFVYDTTRVVSSPEATYVVGDGLSGTTQPAQNVTVDDRLHREPFVGRFVTTDPKSPFRFTLINIHTDPDEAIEEVNALADVFKNVRAFELATAKEDDIILLGDFNAAPEKFAALATIPGMMPAILDQPTNTAETKLYDNILLDKYSTQEYLTRSGVLRMREFFGIDMADAKRLSDHNPVWAEFSFREQMGTAMLGEQPTLLRR